jgi:plasmid stabilization system protein ParE
MKANILAEAEDDLEAAYGYYEAQRQGLGAEMMEEFRHGVEQILRYPNAWQLLEKPFRRYRLHRFPYGIVYNASGLGGDILILAVMHLSRKPGVWRERQ